MMVRRHHRDCVWYLLANDRVVVEWWVECSKAVCGVQWQEDMCMLLSVAYSISVCECNCINVPRKQY